MNVASAKPEVERVMKRLLTLAVAVLAASCGGNSSTTPTPTPTPTPTGPTTFTMAGGVSETAPTATNKIPGATVSFADGTNAGKSTTTDGAGNFSIGNLQAGGFTVNVSAPGYVSRGFPVTISATTPSQTFQLVPTLQILTSSRDDTISGGDSLCDSISPCKQYRLDLHNSGTIDATLTWRDGNTWLWLELYNQSGTRLAQSSQSRVQGLTQHVSANVSGGASYSLRVVWLLGASVTPFTLAATRPN